MLSTPYAPLPQSDKSPLSPPSTAPLSSLNEKPSLSRADSSAALDRPSDASSPARAGHNAAVKAALLTTGVLALGATAGAALFCPPDAAQRAWDGVQGSLAAFKPCGGRAAGQGEAAQPDGEQVGRFWRRAQLERREGGVTELSTSTDRAGNVQTLVKTTRPIINPGGYTIGTLSGVYVPVSTTSATASSDEDETFVRSSSTIPTPTTGAAEKTVYVTLTDETTLTLQTATTTLTETETEYATTTITAAPSARAKRVKRVLDLGLEERGWDFGAVDAHLLHRRGEDFEAAEAQAEAVAEAGEGDVEEAATGKEEFSTSTDRKGSVYTLVKTTRPIINAGGYTIGTLSGAYVDVAKQTDRTITSLPAEPTAAPSKRAVDEQAHRHEELRRRDEERDAQ
ncbi:hypothetical protein JCM10207_004397 [Rhodosporidiobolus poonsookiae]